MLTTSASRVPTSPCPRRPPRTRSTCSGAMAARSSPRRGRRHKHPDEGPPALPNLFSRFFVFPGLLELAFSALIAESFHERTYRKSVVLGTRVGVDEPRVT